MAGKDVDEVRVGVDGVVSVAPTGTAAPTTAIAALNAAFKDLGYVSEDGVTEASSQSAEQVRAWQKAKVVRTLVTEGEVTLQFTLLQTSAEVVAFYYGGTVDTGDGSIVIDATAERPRVALVVDVIDGDETIRIYAPEAQVTEVGDVVYQNGAPIGYEVTVTAHHNETLGGGIKKFFKSLDAA